MPSAAQPGTAQAGVIAAQAAGHVLDPGMLVELGEELGETGLARLFAIFEHDLALRLAALRSAVDDGDGEASMRLCHAMSGAAASIGATSLAARARDGLAAGPIAEPELAAIVAAAAGVVAAIGTWRRTRVGAVA